MTRAGFYLKARCEGCSSPPSGSRPTGRISSGSLKSWSSPTRSGRSRTRWRRPSRARAPSDSGSASARSTRPRTWRCGRRTTWSSRCPTGFRESTPPACSAPTRRRAEARARAGLNDLLLDAGEVAFRDEVRAYLVSTAPERDPLQIFRDRGPRTRALYGGLGKLGWLAIAWPAEFGGGGRPPVFEFILWDELAYARAARLDIGPTVVAKTLMRHGTLAQQDRFLPDLRLGLKGYALGYSEPEAGSDLPGLRVMAVRDGDRYRITGEKRWTSDAHHSDFIWLLARTGTTEQRARGLSLFIVEAHSPGISISPI